ncbi:hypothetical protein Despr_0401 [Desulfobulbus propionicus DSM 2032]|uniref:Uncharacterized protein n=1 Tax=Desulfobulbus propionicus (strain ATCC 33891 / DSM 2032 / VKM B-1956 / 1pr3) TaxID=577650 RepID=A0A7U3YJV0_DESPD|nr:hypothetical protein [Desulfobulbus propionicus]ADW16583.1 hypothetical protein Despr_0401 [Desulfobulbus propionicus DSM 2032]
MVETADYLKMLSRMIRAAGRRVAAADEHELAMLIQLRSEFDQAVQVAIDGQRSFGRSWEHIGLALGLSRQGAFQRYGSKRKNEIKNDLPKPVHLPPP